MYDKAVENTVERDELQDLQERLDSKIRVSLFSNHHEVFTPRYCSRCFNCLAKDLFESIP